MKEVICLAGYEYKKILGRKSNWIAIGFLFLFVFLFGFGGLMGDVRVGEEKVDNYYNMNQKGCRALREMEGKKLDDAFFDEARAVAADSIDVTEEQEELLTLKNGWDNYCRYYMPYGHMEELCLSYLDKAMGEMDEDAFYQGREKLMQENYEAQKLSQEVIAFHKKENRQVETPLAYGNMKGFEQYFGIQYGLGVCLAFIVAICLAPLFAGEYASKMDQMILSSRYGKNKVILAKLFTGFSFTLILTLLVFGLDLLEIGMIYGFDGWNLPVQITREGFNLSIPINLLQMLMIFLLCGIFASCMIGVVVMFLSVKMKTPFGAIILAFIFIFVPIVLNYIVPAGSLWCLLVRGTPTSMMMGWMGVSDQMALIGNHCLYFFQFVPMAYICLAAGLFVWIYHSFRRHQAGN